MTETKGKRLLQELITKYGDVVVAKAYDYYGTRIIHDIKSGWRSSKDPEDMITREVHLSELERIENWDHYKNMELLCQGKGHAVLIPVLVEASKELYDSNEQQLARKKAHQDFQTMMGTGLLNGGTFHTYETLTRMAPVWDTNPTPKQYGQAIAGRRKK